MKNVGLLLINFYRKTRKKIKLYFKSAFTNIKLHSERVQIKLEKKKKKCSTFPFARDSFSYITGPVELNLRPIRAVRKCSSNTVKKAYELLLCFQSKTAFWSSWCMYVCTTFTTKQVRTCLAPMTEQEICLTG